MPDYSPDGGTRAIPKKLTMTEIVAFEYATNCLCRSRTRQNTKTACNASAARKNYGQLRRRLLSMKDTQ
jgi:hypothetical protein